MVNDRDRANLDQVVGIGQRRYPYPQVCWLLSSGQRYWGLAEWRF
jgi:hypothetical protein